MSAPQPNSNFILRLFYLLSDFCLKKKKKEERKRTFSLWGPCECPYKEKIVTHTHTHTPCSYSCRNVIHTTLFYM